MKRQLLRLLAATSVAFFIAGSAFAQNPGTVTNHAVPIGKGAGAQGFGSLVLPNAQIPIGQTGADPIAAAMSGDVTMSAAGVTAIGTNKVANTQIRQSGALALVGRSTNTTGNVGDIQASAGSSCVFLESSSTLTCATITAANIAANAVTNAKLATAAAYTLKGNATGSTAVPTDIDVTALTAKASPVSGDIVLIQDSAASNAMKKTTVGALASAGSVASVNLQTGALVIWTQPQGRLTLTSGTPVMATSVAAATTVYYTGYAGKNVPIYNGTAVAQYQICAANTVGPCENSVALGSNWTTNTNYDFFEALDTGPTLRLCSGPSWNAGAVAGSDVVRGTGAGSTELQQIDGYNTNKNLITCRYNNTTTFSVAANQATYVGTCRMSAAGQTQHIYGASAAGGTAASFNCWNAFNRVSIRTTVNDSNLNWAYTSSTIRAADGSNGNRASFITGLSEDGFSCQYTNRIILNSAANTNFTIGCALDSITVFDRKNLSFLASAIGIVHLPVSVKNDYNAALGWHFVQALEAGDGTNANQSAGASDMAFIFEFAM